MRALREHEFEPLRRFVYRLHGSCWSPAKEGQRLELTLALYAFNGRWNMFPLPD
jgi:hypothetical protein